MKKINIVDAVKGIYAINQEALHVSKKIKVLLGPMFAEGTHLFKRAII